MTARNAFLSAFSDITGTGRFHSEGTTPFFLPQLHVDGLGELAFPLPAAQAKALIPLAEAAPYGQGEKTLFDDAVRKCWQIDASRFSIKSPRWKKALVEILEHVGVDLGIRGTISAHPYKLLIYGKGGHFKAHRDTEKLDAMFGTLIIALPSSHEGGRLFVRHGGREIEVDFSREDHWRDFQHAAFFADCEHEVESVRSGYRCCLVYNLRLDKGDPSALNASLDAQARTLLPSLAALKRERAGDLSAVLLEHSYTEANLSLRKLKGNDQSRARALLAAAKEAGLAAHLALVTFHQSGSLEGSDGYYYGDDVDPEDGTMGEIYEESLIISHWRNDRDRPVELGNYSIEPEALVSDEKFDEGEPDEKEAEGHTGNAGCTMDYWYRRAAIVLWAEKDQEDLLCRYNFRGACTMLSELAREKNTGPGSRFHRLGEAILSGCADELTAPRYQYPGRHVEDSPFAIMLEALAKARSRDLLDQLFNSVPPTAFSLCDATLWKKLFNAFGVDAFAPVCKALTSGDAAENRHALFQLLNAFLARKDATSWSSRIAARLARLAPQEPQHTWEKSRDPKAPGNPEETHILLAASHLLEDETDRRHARAFLQADSSLPYIRDVLGPVLLMKPLIECFRLPHSLAPEILTFAKTILADEVARPLLPYPDWTRPLPESALAPPSASQFSYGRDRLAQKVFQELAAFMADPAARTHSFSYTQDQRSALETFISDHFLDLDHTTIRKGRPHSLQCSKNNGSYEHALSLRAKDKALLDKLGQIKPA